MAPFQGLELLATAVVVLDDRFTVRYANPAAESLLATGARSLNGQPFLQLFAEREALERALGDAVKTHWDYSAQSVTYSRAGVVMRNGSLPFIEPGSGDQPVSYGSGTM